jgi:16S rRNA (guanine527-N7)-methyltransferase
VANFDRDLTRLVGFENIVLKHYIDSMYITRLLKLPSPLLDVGTGAGFPGIPLKIMCPSLRIILAEPRPRRIEFLQAVCKRLDLQGIEVFPHRVVSQSFQRPVAGLITRALETIDKTLARSAGCTYAGSRLFFMKGPAVDIEIEAAKQRFAGEFRHVATHCYVLPHTQHERRLVVFERISTGRGVSGSG